MTVFLAGTIVPSFVVLKHWWLWAMENTQVTAWVRASSFDYLSVKLTVAWQANSELSTKQRQFYSVAQKGMFNPVTWIFGLNRAPAPFYWVNKWLARVWDDLSRSLSSEKILTGKREAGCTSVSAMAIERARYITGLAEAMVYFRTGENRIYGSRILRNCLV